jgi:hypothetical protein
LYFFTVQAIDNRGLVSDPSNEVSTDASAPDPPANLSADRPVGVYSSDPAITVSWDAASDPAPGSGIKGYYYRFDADDAAAASDATGHFTSETTAQSPPLGDGAHWWFHISAVDNAGNLSPPADPLGPFFIDATPPFLLPFPSTRIDFSTSPPRLYLGFSENDMQNAATGSNYTLSLGESAAFSPAGNGVEESGAALDRFSFPLPADVKIHSIYTLTVGGSVTDPAGNRLDPRTIVINDDDQDGMADDWEVLHWGDTSREAGGDEDNDGLSNLSEYIGAPKTGTDPNDPDTDGDGWLDGDEDRNRNGVLDPGEADPNDPASFYDAGDFNTDGRVDMADILLLLKGLAGADAASAPNPRADLDGDGVPTAADLIYLLQMLAEAREK